MEVKRYLIPTQIKLPDKILFLERKQYEDDIVDKIGKFYISNQFQPKL